MALWNQFGGACLLSPSGFQFLKSLYININTSHFPPNQIHLLFERNRNQMAQLFFFLLILLLCARQQTCRQNSIHESSSPPYPAAPTPLVPAFFVIGDSTVDCGTNNYLGTLARADRPPYGRDFDTHQPTGRFSNGRIIVDFLALRLGLPFVPPFLGQGEGIGGMIQGLNYASAAAGIIFSSGSDLGMHVPLSEQMEQVMETFQQLQLNLGREAAADLISKSVFYVSIGSNDFIHYYLKNVSDVQSRYLPWEFAKLLTNTTRQHLKNLYAAGARKFVVMGIGPLGCAPHYLWEHGGEDGECVTEINNLVTEFNFGMRFTVDNLNRKLPGSRMIFCDVLEGSMDIMANRERYGFETTKNACCGFGRFGGWIMCLSPEMACGNASTHVWWDEFHPTAAVNRILADDIWEGTHTNMCYPVNLKNIAT